MRKHLLDTFDDIYIYNLHGNKSRKEKSPDGTVDENVFDIRQGVSISIFIKTSSSKIGAVYYHNSFGKEQKVR
jgi:predicted helicase